MQTFISSKSRFFLFFAFCFSFFVFRFTFFAFCFSLFVFRFSLFDHRSVSCCNCYMRTLIRECLSEWVRKWVFYVNQTAHAICRRSFGQSQDSFCFSLSLFVFRFSLFVFRFSLFDHRSVSCCNCYLRTLIRECLSEWVRKWVSECFTSIKQLMPHADVHLVKVKILFDFHVSLFFFAFRFSFFAFRFSFFAFRFSFFSFRFSIIGPLHAFTV